MNELDIESTHVLLIGAGNYPNWPQMNIPNVSANLAELASLLSDPFYCGIPKEKISVIQDQDVENTNSALQEFFDNIQTSKATVILYYSGHGLQSTKAMDDLFLATRNIKETRFEASSVKISELRKLFSDCVASKKILLLDCCYAGKITKGFMSDNSSENVAKLNEFDGTYIMAASSEYERARFDPDDPNSPTKFTGKLIDVIKNGIESDDEYCTLNSIYSQIRSSFLIQKDAPRPVQIGQNNIGSFPIFKNKKFFDRIPRDEEAWNKASVMNNVIAYNAFIDEYPQSKYKKEAEKLIQNIEDEEAWVRARDKDTIGGYRYYLNNYLKYAVEARQQLNVLVRIQEEEELWKSVNAENNIESFQKYLDQFPDGKYLDLARRLINSLTGLEQEEILWKTLDHKNVIVLNEYLNTYPKGRHFKTAKSELQVLRRNEEEKLRLDAQKGFQRQNSEHKTKNDHLIKVPLIEPEKEQAPNDDMFWQGAIADNTINSYKKYIHDFPKGKFVNEAHKKAGELLASKTGTDNINFFTKLSVRTIWKILIGCVIVVIILVFVLTGDDSSLPAVEPSNSDTTIIETNKKSSPDEQLSAELLDSIKKYSEADPYYDEAMQNILDKINIAPIEQQQLDYVKTFIDKCNSAKQANSSLKK